MAAGQGEEREGPERGTFWVRFSATFLTASAISFLYIASDHLPLHLLKVATVGTLSGLAVARFGDGAVRWLVRLSWWT